MTKFILVGFPRTGTTVLAGSIITHPEVLFYGELFNNTPEVRHAEAQRITLGAGWKFETALDWGISACSYTGSTHEYLANCSRVKSLLKQSASKLCMTR